jgi:hypothetical protein
MSRKCEAQRSAKASLASIASTFFSSSASVSGAADSGGKPVRSKLKRRSKVRESASGAGWRPFCSSLAKMKRSTSFAGHAVFFTAGGVCGCGGWKDQKLPSARVVPLFAPEALGASRGSGAPDSIQSFKSAISLSLSFRFGGIFKSRSV